MRFSTAIAFAAGLLGLASAAPGLEPRIPKNMKPSKDEWKMDKASGSSATAPVWVANKKVGPMDNIEALYTEASKAFNWVKKQNNALTSKNNLLVAAFYDKSSESIFASTIPRGSWEDLMHNDGKHGKIWRAHYQDIRKERADAEDSAYFWSEVQKNTQPDPSKKILDYVYGDGQKKAAKVAVWGVYSSDKVKVKKEAGTPIASCDGCKQLAKKLGVYYEDPK
ncbi:hypothetical protein PG990_015191 [Apiospora arundinis]